MNTDKIEGGVRELAGEAQQGLGRVFDDQRQRAEGLSRQIAGRAQEAYGEAREQVSHAVEQQPALALLVAGAIGFMLGALIRR